MAYRAKDEVEAVVHGFESCRTPADAFTHADHLAVAAYYLRGDSEETALVKIREGLLRFLTFHGVGTQKYNETITLFWLKQVNACLNESDPRLSWVGRVNVMLEQLGSSRLVFEYYSEALLESPDAKSGWVEPDLKKL